MNNNRDSLKNILRREGLSRDNSPILHVKRNGKLDVLKRYATLQIIEKSMPEETYSLYFPYIKTIEQKELEKAINKVSSLITGKYFIATKLGKGEKKTYLVVNRMVKKLGVLGQQIGFKFEKYEIVTNKKKRKKNK